MPKLIKRGLMQIRKAEQMINSWFGYAKYSNSYNFVLKLLGKFTFLNTKTSKGKMKIIINKEELHAFN